MQYSVKAPKKLIEVALPLDSINEAAKVEKAVPRRGHPQTLHYWWARRPLAAVRAVIFAQMVNDPGYQQGGGFKYGKNKKEAAIERKRLFSIVEELALWENTTNEEVLERARAEIRRSWREVCELNKDHPQSGTLFNPKKIPALHDPFAGGGTIPLEAQRLGLEAYASDLNPVAVLVSKAMIEIAPRFGGRAPIGPLSSGQGNPRLGLPKVWPGATGLAEDVRRYGSWMQTEAEKRIGHLYPRVTITAEMASDRSDLKSLVGQKLPVVALLWARTVRSPNPAFSHVEVPLSSTFILSTKEGKNVYVDPIVEADHYSLTVKIGTPPRRAEEGTKLARGANFSCVMSGVAIEPKYIKAEGLAGRLGAKLMSILAHGPGGRIYLPPIGSVEIGALEAKPKWKPDLVISGSTQYLGVKPYGMERFSQLFTDRQLVALTTFSDLVSEARDLAKRDALAAGFPDDDTPLAAGGAGAHAYSEAISIYLGCALSRLSSYNNTMCIWNMKGGSVAQIFARQAIPMSWDYIEVYPLAERMSGNWIGGIEWVADVIDRFVSGKPEGSAQQLNASKQELSVAKVISTDPPYYDNVPYADLSDFFYVWLRSSLKSVFPDVFATLSTPKNEELVAFAYRHGDKVNAEAFFLNGMTEAMHRLAQQAHPAFPVTIYYAFRQSETKSDTGTASTGWETFLGAVIRAGFAISGTWPMRTERIGGVRNVERNSLASSIILVCRPRPDDAPTVSRRGFLRELNQVLPEALDEMTRGSGDDRSPVAPVDLSQAIIGPGMAVFSKYAAVLEADGTPMTVKTALGLINRFLAEDDFDPDTQFCLHWFEQHGWKDGKFGSADTLARAKGTSVDGVKQSGILHAAGGLVHLLKWVDYPTEWDPTNDTRLPVWEVLHHLIRIFKAKGETGTGAILAAVQTKAEATRQLAYRLYTLCERAGWAEDARAYNEIVTSWSAIESAAAKVPGLRQVELPLLFDV